MKLLVPVVERSTAASASRGLTAIAAALCALVLTALPASAQTAVEAYNGNWRGDALTVEAGDWPEMAPNGFSIAIKGDSDEFEAEWTAVVPDDDTLEWDEVSADFESSDRAGFFEPDDLPEIFDGDAQFWAYASAEGLVLGRLQIDDDSGRHAIFACHLFLTETGLDAVLVLSSTGVQSGRARISLVRQ